MNAKHVFAAGLTALGFLVSACAAPTIATQVVIPPRSAEAATLRRVAVVPFSGSDGRNFSDLLRAELQGASVNGTLYFTVISNEALAAAGVGNNVPRLVAAGRAAGVDAVYLGASGGANVQRSTRTERRKRCVEYEGFMNCKREEEYTATCYNTVATYSATPQVVNVGTGAVAFTEALSSRRQYEYCDDGQQTTTQEQLIAAARQDVVRTLRQRVAPYNTTVNVDYKSTAPDLEAAQREHFEGGVAFARAGQVDRACAMWRELAPGDQTTSLSLLYNLGVCAEVVGDYPRAVQLYSRAESMLTQPDRQVHQARERAQGRLEGERAVQSLTAR